MKVLHVIPTLDHVSGGPSLALVGLATALHRAGVDVAVAVDQPRADDPVLLDRLRGADVEVIAGADGASGRLSRARLAQAVGACDVCHIHATWERVLHQAAVLCRQHGRPHVFRPCGMLDPWCLAQGRLKKRAYIALRLRRDLDRCSAIHFTTPIERDLVRPLRFRAPTIVEPNGVELGEFETLPAPGTFRRDHPEIGDRPMVLFLSRLHAKKGLDLLIPAFSGVNDREARLVIAGPDEGGYRATVEAMIARHDLGGRVIVTGMLSGPQRVAAYVDADLFALSSYQENFGAVVVEALAAGTPVVISDQVNIHPEISAANVGEIVPQELPRLAETLNRWLGDADLRAAAAARSRPFVRDRYDWGRIAQRWAERYERFAQGRLPEDADRMLS